LISSPFNQQFLLSVFRYILTFRRRIGRIGRKDAGVDADQLDQHGIGAEFNNSVPRYENAVGRGQVFKELFATRDDYSQDLAETGKLDIANSAELSAVADIDNYFLAKLQKGIVLQNPTSTEYMPNISKYDKIFNQKYSNLPSFLTYFSNFCTNL
jgi:hypothetical protein